MDYERPGPAREVGSSEAEDADRGCIQCRLASSLVAVPQRGVYCYREVPVERYQ
jgi:hypothetical protein